MATETTEGNLFASLLNEAPPEGEETAAQDTSEQATEASTEGTASESNEQQTGDEDEILDALSKEESEEESEWDGKSPLNEHPRFKKLITQRNEEKVARKEAEARLSELETSTELYTEVYGGFENPEQQFRLDTAFIKAMDTLYTKDVDIVKQAAVIVNEFIKTGKVLDGHAPKEPRMSKSESSPADNAVARELYNDRVDALLGATAIKPEFATVIRRHALESFDGRNLSKAAIKEVVGEFIKENGWTAEILTGKQAKPASQGKPAAARPARRVESSNKPQAEASKSEVTSPDDLRAQMRANLQDLLTQSR